MFYKASDSHLNFYSQFSAAASQQPQASRQAQQWQGYQINELRNILND